MDTRTPATGPNASVPNQPAPADERGDTAEFLLTFGGSLAIVVAATAVAFL